MVDSENNPEMFWFGFFTAIHSSEGRHLERRIIKSTGWVSRMKVSFHWLTNWRHFCSWNWDRVDQRNSFCRVSEKGHIRSFKKGRKEEKVLSKSFTPEKWMHTLQDSRLAEMKDWDDGLGTCQVPFSQTGQTREAPTCGLWGWLGSPC